jgi:subtilisin family serine protease
MSGPIYRLPPWRQVGSVLVPLSPQERDWGLNQFDVPRAWKKSRGAGVRIAILDTGIDATHCDLQGQVIAQRDFTNSPYGAADLQSHGTHCAGVIAARENDEGIVGVCPDISEKGGGLIVAKVLGDDGSGRGTWVASGIDWAIEQGANVVSMSLGSSQYDPRIHEAIQRAIETGAFVIAAAGNDGRGAAWRDRVNYPGRLAETIAVGAVGRDGMITEFSSRGPSVDIVAPGENILSTVPGNKWVRMSGTSMATPFVAAVVGLVLSLGELRGVKALRELLFEHAQDAGAPGRDPAYGVGLIRPDKMIESLVPAEPPNPSDAGVWVWVPGGSAVTGTGPAEHVSS